MSCKELGVNDESGILYNKSYTLFPHDGIGRNASVILHIPPAVPLTPIWPWKLNQ